MNPSEIGPLLKVKLVYVNIFVLLLDFGVYMFFNNLLPNNYPQCILYSQEAYNKPFA